MSSDSETLYKAGECRYWTGATRAQTLAARAVGDFDGWLRKDLTVADVKEIIRDIAKRFEPVDGEGKGK